MRPKVKRVIRDAQVLSGATANYVSLVTEGANETPFIEIKSKHGDKHMAIKKRKGGQATSHVAKSHKPISSAKKNIPSKLEKVVARFEYDTDEFETEDAVREHMGASDWDGEFTIAKNADGD